MQGQTPKTWKDLTPKQKAWVDYYKAGHDQTTAARLAGYKDAKKAGWENSTNLHSFVYEREAVLENPRIATMEEVNAFWTKVMNDEHEKTQDRLKASELRARAAGGFLERVELSGADPVKIVVDIPRAEAE